MTKPTLLNLVVAIRGRMPDTNSSSGIMVIFSVPLPEHIPSVVNVGRRKYVHFHITRSPLDVAYTQRWQGASFLARTTWLLSKALHNVCLPALFLETVTPGNAVHRYNALIEYLNGKYDEEIINILNRERNLFTTTKEWWLTNYYQQKGFLRVVVDRLAQDKIYPAISVSQEVVQDRMFWDNARGGVTLFLPQGWILINYTEDRQSDTYVEIYDKYVVVESGASLSADRVNGLFTWEKFVNNIVSGYWIPVEYRGVSDVSVSVETFTEGGTRHQIAARAFSPDSALSAAFAQMKQFAPAVITAMVFFVPEGTSIEKTVLENFEMPEGIRSELKKLEIRHSDDHQYILLCVLNPQ